jgi:pSer/pThr/pTyr-binding forkhead associated (FHA) protein
LAGGILLLVLGLGLCVAAIITFKLARKRPAPQAQTPIATPPVPIDDDATLVVGHGYGTLHAISGPLSGQIFALRDAGLTIGRDRTQAEVIVEDPSVSKKHVWVGVRDGAVQAIDQSSTKGTYLNSLGTRINEVRLAPGDTLILSDDAARFVYRA